MKNYLLYLLLGIIYISYFIDKSYAYRDDLSIRDLNYTYIPLRESALLTRKRVWPYYSGITCSVADEVNNIAYLFTGNLHYRHYSCSRPKRIVEVFKINVTKRPENWVAKLFKNSDNCNETSDSDFYQINSNIELCNLKYPSGQTIRNQVRSILVKPGHKLRLGKDCDGIFIYSNDLIKTIDNTNGNDNLCVVIQSGNSKYRNAGLSTPGYCSWNNCNGISQGGDYCNLNSNNCRYNCGNGALWCSNYTKMQENCENLGYIWTNGVNTNYPGCSQKCCKIRYTNAGYIQFLTEPNPMIENRMIIGGTSYYDSILDQRGVGSKGSDRITSCGIDHQKNVLYYIGSNEFKCSNSYNTKSSLVRINLNDFTFRDRIYFRDVSHPKFNNNDDYLYFPSTSIVDPGKYLYLSFNYYNTAIFRIDLGSNHITLNEYIKEKLWHEYDTSMQGTGEMASGYYIEMGYFYRSAININKRKAYFLHDTINWGDRSYLITIDLDKPFYSNNSYTKIHTLEGVTGVSKFDIDTYTNNIYLLTGEKKPTFLYHYDEDLNKIILENSCGRDSMEFPIEGTVKNFNLDSRTGYIYSCSERHPVNSINKIQSKNLIYEDTDDQYYITVPFYVAQNHMYDYSYLWDKTGVYSNNLYQPENKFKLDYLNNTINFEKLGMSIYSTTINGPQVPYVLLIQNFGCIPGRGSLNGSCSECRVGKFSNTNNFDECYFCPIGKTTNKNASLECLSCDTGKYAPFTGMSICIECSPGMYNNKLGSDNCQKCPEDTYQTNYGSKLASNCLQCPKGQISSSGSNICRRCEGGYYKAGKNKCLPCDKGKYGSLIGGDNIEYCINCPIGKFNSKIGSTGSHDCLNCLPGRINNNPGASSNISCVKCERGKYRSDSMTECNDCIVGSISEYGSTECQLCEIGKYTTNLIECASCPNGKYAENKGSYRCLDCPLGKISINGTKCQQCSPGFITTNQIECLSCPAGKHTQNGVSNKCFNCAEGKIAINKTQCQQCSPGFITTNQIDCVACPAGKHTQIGISNKCFDCEKGKISSISSSNCINCLPGFFTNNLIGCNVCSPGKYSNNNNGNSQCFDCPEGKISINATKCVVCQPGFITNDKVKCSSCQEGKYTQTGISNKCFDCPDGSISFKNSSKCSVCPSGKYTSNKVKCVNCPEGSFSENNGNNDCSVCANGYISGIGFKKCTPCLQGTYTNGNLPKDHTKCISCVKGKYSSTYAGNSVDVCINCPLGKYNSEIGSNSSIHCKICPPGKFSEVIGSETISNCQDCVRGKYLPIGGGESEIDCLDTPLGEISQIGAGNTIKCPKGKYSNNINSWECIQCPKGKFSEQEGSINCKNCPPNSEQTENKDGWNCIEGSYESISNTTRECISCPKNTFCPKGTLIESIQLNEGYWRPHSHSLNIIGCRKKEYCIGGYDNISTNICRKGHYGPLCDNCIKGWAKVSGGVCARCPEEDRELNYMISLGFVIVLSMIITMLIRTANPVDNKKDEFSGVLKVLTNYLQVFSLAKNFDIKWPPLVYNLFEAAETASSPSIQFYSSDCAIGWSYYERFLVYLSMPLIYSLSCLAILSLITLIITPIRNKKRKSLPFDKIDNFNIHNPVGKKFLFKWMRISLVVGLFLMYPTIIKNLFQIINCTQVGDKYYLSRDFKVECYTKEHILYALISYIFLGIYGIGIPFSAFYFLYKFRNRLYSSDIVESLKFLYIEYKPNRYYWEMVIMFRKISIIFMSVFLFSKDTSRYQMVFASWLVQLSLILHIYFRPYDTITEFGQLCNRLEIFSLTTLVITLNSGIIFGTKQDDYPLGIFEIILMFLVFIINILIVVTFIYHIFITGSKKTSKSLRNICKKIIHNRNNQIRFCCKFCIKKCYFGKYIDKTRRWSMADLSLPKRLSIYHIDKAKHYQHLLNTRSKSTLELDLFLEEVKMFDKNINSNLSEKLLSFHSKIELHQRQHINLVIKYNNILYSMKEKINRYFSKNPKIFSNALDLFQADACEHRNTLLDLYNDGLKYHNILLEDITIETIVKDKLDKIINEVVDISNNIVYNVEIESNNPLYKINDDCNIII